MRVTEPASATLCRAPPHTILGKIEEDIAGFGVKYLRADGHADYDVVSADAVSIRPFSVPTALGDMFGVVTQVKQGV
jgi:hypothetical protein